MAADPSSNPFIELMAQARNAGAGADYESAIRAAFEEAQRLKAQLHAHVEPGHVGSELATLERALARFIGDSLSARKEQLQVLEGKLRERQERRVEGVQEVAALERQAHTLMKELSGVPDMHEAIAELDINVAAPMRALAEAARDVDRASMQEVHSLAARMNDLARAYRWGRMRYGLMRQSVRAFWMIGVSCVLGAALAGLFPPAVALGLSIAFGMSGEYIVSPLVGRYLARSHRAEIGRVVERLALLHVACLSLDVIVGSLARER